MIKSLPTLLLYLAIRFTTFIQILEVQKGILFQEYKTTISNKIFQYFKNRKNKFKFGFSLIYHNIISGVITAETEYSISELDLPHKYTWKNAVYISHEYKANNLLGIEYGISLSSFSRLGTG